MQGFGTQPTQKKTVYLPVNVKYIRKSAFCLAAKDYHLPRRLARGICMYPTIIAIPGTAIDNNTIKDQKRNGRARAVAKDRKLKCVATLFFLVPAHHLSEPL